jgi:hypothetical protein
MWSGSVRYLKCRRWEIYAERLFEVDISLCWVLIPSTSCEMPVELWHSTPQFEIGK